MRSFVLAIIVLALQFNTYAGNDGGGGTFTIPLFWERVETVIIPQLKELKATKETSLLTVEEIDKLLFWMNEEVTKVSLTVKELFVIENGKKVPVDAVNRTASRSIELYKPVWQNLYDAAYSVDFLILHEFMGLAQISDVDSKVSRKILPPRKEAISFHANTLICESSMKYIRTDSESWYIIDMPIERAQAVELSEAKALNFNAMCGLLDPDTGECLRYVEDYKVKSASVSLPLVLHDGDVSDGSYSIDATINLLSDYYHYGWGGRANTLFLTEPSFQIVWKLVRVDTNGKRQVLNILSQEAHSTDEYSSDVSIHAQIPIPAFLEALDAKGLSLSLHPYSGELSNMFHSYNIAGFLDHLATTAGYKNGRDMDQYVLNQVLNGIAGNALPFRAFVSCVLKN